jgi:hypothetical protein
LKGREGTHAINRLTNEITMNVASLCQLDVGGDRGDQGGEEDNGEVLCMRTSDWLETSGSGGKGDVPWTAYPGDVGLVSKAEAKEGKGEWMRETLGWS